MRKQEIMKNISVLLVASSLTLLTACGGTQSTTTDEKQTTTNNRGRSNSEISATTNSTTGSRQSARQNEAAAAMASERAAEEQARMQRMYSDLDLDDGQISRFESEWKSAETAWKRSNRQKEMNNYERTELQDRIFREILDDRQFEKYQKWARENARSGN